MNTKTVGEYTEARILSALLRMQLHVLLPWGDNQRYDLVFEKDNVFYRVQCKTGQLVNGSMIFRTASSYAHRNRPGKDYTEDVDFFGVYCPQLDKVYLIPIEDILDNGSCVNLRVTEPKNSQVEGIRWASKYEI